MDSTYSTSSFVGLVSSKRRLHLPPYRFAKPKFRQMDPHLYEAAQDLGCSPFKAFIKVVLPEIMPGVVSGFLMAFTYSLDDFVISYFTSGSSSQTLPVTIYSMTRRKVSPEINALSTIIFVVVVVILIVKNFIEIRQLKKKGA